MFATYVYSADPFGNDIDAGKTGATIPVQARLYYVKEGTEEADETLSCGSSTFTCKKIVGDRGYSAGSDFASSTATFAGVQGASKGNGIFASTYKLAPGLNEIQIKGNGTITDKRSHNSCEAGCKIEPADTITLNESITTIKVYGVDITISPSGNIYTDKDGYSYNDFRIDYTINPADYKPLNEAVILYKDNEMIDYIASDVGSTGSATLAKGFQFDIGSKYDVEVVLNYGTGVEIRSNRLTLPIGMVKMVADDDGTTPMVGAVTDGTARLRLQLTVKYNREAFAGLTWQLIDPQVMDYTPISIKGGFVSGDTVVDSRPVTFNANGVAEAIYRAPETFVRWETLYASSDKDLAERLIQLTVDLAGYFKTLKDPLPPIRLKRPPVVLVHGLWGCGNRDGCSKGNKYAWDVFEAKFNERGQYDITPVNYYRPGEVLSISNLWVQDRFRKTLDSAQEGLRDKGFSSVKVDIIAHSMGGLLTRQYCYNNTTACQNKIHRFITIATPHFGSELADILRVYRDQREFFPDNWHVSFFGPIPVPLHCQKRVKMTVRGEWGIEPHPIEPAGGAIDDLAAGKLPDFLSGIKREGRWNSYPPLAERLRAHTIVGDTPEIFDGFSFDIDSLWKYVLIPCGFTRGNVFGQNVANDRIVAASSQRELLSGNKTTLINLTDHFTVRNSAQTVDNIKQLLDEPVGYGSFTRE